MPKACRNNTLRASLLILRAGPGHFSQVGSNQDKFRPQIFNPLVSSNHSHHPPHDNPPHPRIHLYRRHLCQGHFIGLSWSMPTFHPRLHRYSPAPFSSTYLDPTHLPRGNFFDAIINCLSIEAIFIFAIFVHRGFSQASPLRLFSQSPSSSITPSLKHLHPDCLRRFHSHRPRLSTSSPSMPSSPTPPVDPCFLGRSPSHHIEGDSGAPHSDTAPHC
jgi:hypothetical protein